MSHMSAKSESDESDGDEEPKGSPRKSRDLLSLESDFLGMAETLPSLRAQSKKRRSGRIAEIKAVSGHRGRQAADFDRSAPVVRKPRTGMWNGQTRPDYLDGTRVAVLETMKTKKVMGEPFYQCPGSRSKPPHWITEEEVTIDHVKNWRDWIDSSAELEEDGQISNESAQAAYSDPANLAGMCRPCNSSKGGPRGR